MTIMRSSGCVGVRSWGGVWWLVCFFFNDTATTEIYTLSLHDALPIREAGARIPDFSSVPGSAPRSLQAARALGWPNNLRQIGRAHV